jgi:tRNA G10  N-methylase Trm11
MRSVTAPTEPVDHPAKFSSPVLTALGDLLAGRVDDDARVLDPFAGVGGVHALQWETVGVEIESEWAAQHPGTVVGDSTRLLELFDRESFDAVATSPAYGNRMADSYAGDAKGTRRFTYRISLGRVLSPRNGGGMQWGDEYRALHEAVWRQCWAALKPGGWMLVNVSNHIRGGVEQPVVEWHTATLIGLGFLLDEVRPVGTRRMRYGANGRLRVDSEKILVFRRPD